jgi:hypothetical protein
MPCIVLGIWLLVMIVLMGIIVAGMFKNGREPVSPTQDPTPPDPGPRLDERKESRPQSEGIQSAQEDVTERPPQTP